MKASALVTAHTIGLQEDQTSLVCLDTRYIAGIMMLVRSLEVGMNILAVEPCANPLEKIGDHIVVDFAAFAPYQVKSILQSPQKKYFNQVKSILIGGAPLDELTKLELQDYSCQFYESYGMTETISHIALKKINGINKSDYFEILHGITIRQDERGCLCIKAPYLSDEIITNDVVELKNPQEFIWLGRFDHVINSGGVKIFPESVEKKIAPMFINLKIDSPFFIVGLPNDRLGETVALLIEGDLSKDQLSQIENGLKKCLDKFEIPRSIQCIEKFIKTETGKVNRKLTVAQLADSNQK